MSAGKTINEQLGLRRKTRKRTYTHGAAIRSSEQCPNCGAYRVRENTLNRIVVRSCDACAHRWRPNGEPEHTYRDGVGELRCDGCLCTHPKHTPDCRFKEA